MKTTSDTTYYLTDARMVLPHGTDASGSLVLRDGKIAAVCPELAPPDAIEINLHGHLLLPGLIDLHCDAIEKEVEPRPGVYFPLPFACAQVDRRNAIAGITTVYHALSFANHELGVRNNTMAADIIRTITARRHVSLVDNRVHARYEVTDDTAPAILANLLREGDIQLLSFMDHSPGQGQFKEVDAFRQYLSRSYQTSEAEFDRILEAKREAGRHAMARMSELADLAAEHGICLASHDDDTPEKVDLMNSLGATLSEFPINLETAQAAQASGLTTLFGAPNILRGKSQSGAMRALDAVLAGVADCLCGDYSPASVLPATLRVAELAGMPLHQAIALVTRHPALAAGLSDRGSIATGLRGDLIAVRMIDGTPQTSHVWVAGHKVLSTDYPHA